MYKKRELWIPREEAQELEEDEYYIADLIGMDVVLEEEFDMGELKRMLLYLLDKVKADRREMVKEKIEQQIGSLHEQ